MARFLNYVRFKAFKDDNSPAAGWKVWSYQAGTSTPQDTYTDQTQATPNANPVVLDGSGEADIWLDPDLAYKIVITDDADVQQRETDGIQNNDNADFEDVTAETVTVSGAITSTVPDGTVPLVIASTTKVANLNADLLDNQEWSRPGPIGSVTPAAATVTTLTANSTVTKKANDIQQSANGAQWIHGQISEELVLNTAGPTTDSVADLLPANSLIECVTARVTEAISTAANWSIGDPTTAARFLAATTDLIIGTSKAGLDHWNPAGAAPANGPQQSAPAKLRITCNANPSGGKIRVTVFYRQFGADLS